MIPVNESVTRTCRFVTSYGTGLSNDTLRCILGLSHSGAVRLVDKLVAEGLVERGPGRDARQVALHLTRRGKQYRSQLLASRLIAVEQILGSLDQSEQRALAELLHKVLCADGHQRNAAIYDTSHV